VSFLPLFLGAVGLSDVVLSAAVSHVARDGSIPGLPFDPNTTKHCSWWLDLKSAKNCADILADNTISLDTFRRWVRETVDFVLRL